MTDQAFPRGKRKSTSTTTASTNDDTATAPIQKDFLFGSIEPLTPRKTKKPKLQTVNKTISALPLGGGAVLPPTTSGGKVTTPAKIELLTFGKLAKGIKVLGVIREVHEEYGVISLPTMLMGFVRREENGPPLTEVLPSSNTIMAFTILSTTTTDVKGGKKRRIELSPLPKDVNAGFRLDDFISGRGKSTEGEICVTTRGRIVSVEDHGCLVDIGSGKNAFLKFDAIEDDYEITENMMDVDNEAKSSSSNKKMINSGRIYDFALSPKSQNGPIMQLSLPSVDSLARIRLADNITPTLASLQPGMLTEVKVEQHAKNGICVNFIGGLYRGSIDEDHLGGHNGDKGEGMWWKGIFRGRHGKFTARIIAVDTATKIIRFSLNPHILALRGEYASFPYPIGTIIENSHVIRVDPGVGALLALPGTDGDEEDINDHILQLDKDLSNNLFSIPEYREASRVHTTYVHISKSIDCKDEDKSSKKGKKSLLNRTPEALFARHFSLNTKIKALRILSTSHLIDGIASCATAKSIVEAHVLTHEDIAPGAIYRNVPVIQMFDGGGVLVDLGVGTKGIIPASHLFDKASHGNLDTGGDMVLSGYRQKIRSAKYKEGSLVDVRCLTCDPVTKQCVLTAKKTLLSMDAENPIVDYTNTMKIGRVAAGFISRVDENGITVTFYNNVHGRVSSRSLAAELGVEDPKLNYALGDVVAARVVDCQRRRNRNTSNKEEGNAYYYHLILSLKTVIEEKSIVVPTAVDSAKNASGSVPFVAGSLLEAKRIKVLQMINCLERDDGRFLSGYAVVNVKSKFFSDMAHGGDSVDFKLPYDHLLDSYGDELSNPPIELDNIAAKYLTVGKKIDAEGFILSVPKGVDTLPIISLRPSLISTLKNTLAGGEGIISCPSPKSNLFMGEYVRGYVCRIDDRFGAFVRFLDGLTGLIPKLKKGLNERLHDTILCKVTALDITSSPPKILLKKVKETEIVQKKKKKVGSKTFKSNNTVQVDDVVDVKISDINFARANVYIIGKSGEAKSRARIHVTMADSVSTKHKLSKKEKQAREAMKIRKNHPFYKWKVGDVLKDVRCVGVDFRDGINYIEMSNRKADSVPPSAIVTDPTHLPPGSEVSVIITSISSSALHHGIWVQLCPGIAGFIPSLEVSNDPDVLNDLANHFIVGSRISACVTNKKVSTVAAQTTRMQDQHGDHVIELSILLASSPNKPKSDLHASRAPKPKRGDIIVGCISKKTRMLGPPSLMLNLRGGLIGRCCITELTDVEEWVNMPLGNESANRETSSAKSKQDQHRIFVSDSDHDNEDKDYDVNVRGDESEYSDGTYVRCCVLGNVKNKNQIIELSLRDSRRVNGDLNNDSIPVEGESVHGFVVSTTKVGCFVRLSRTVESRVILKELSDEFIPRPDELFPPGRLVVGKVKSVKKLEPSKNSNLTAMVDLDMRESVLLTSGKRLTLDDIEPNSKYTGVVTRVESYGVFVRIDNSDISGLAHVSECSDTYVKNLFDLYNPGDMVKLLIIKCEEDKTRLGFSLKASNFVDESDSDEEDSDEEDSDEEEINEKTFAMSSENDSDGVEDHSINSDDENFVSKIANKMTEADMEEDSDSSSENGSESEESENEDDDYSGKPLSVSMDTNVGFDWNAKLAEKSSDDDSSSDSSDDESEDDDVAFQSSHKSRKKAAARRKEEEEISRREVALADGTADEIPETAADFERLVASSPNSSETWMKYMAFHLSLADIESARSVANRAFERIEFREEGEKLNVWTALLTLELKFGTNASLQETVDRACQHNNPKQVYLRVCELLEKEVDAAAGATGSNNLTSIQRADDFFAKMCRKFKSKKTVWIAHFRYLLKSSRHEEAHDLLKRSHQSLPKYKHVETMIKFAGFEFELGSPERGRTIFSAMLSRYPKRMDLLFVNIDKEIKNGDISKARALFDSVVNPVSQDSELKFKFSDKQMKSLFKKWYRMEDEHGNEETQERVKDEARGYVARSKP